MSVLAYPTTNEIFRNCTKECGIITSTEDQQYFTVRCITCSEKFLHLDAFIQHMQTGHLPYDNDGSMNGLPRRNNKSTLKRHLENEEDDLSTVPQTPAVIIKKEKNEGDYDDDNVALTHNEPLTKDGDGDYDRVSYNIIEDIGDSSYMGTNSYDSCRDDGLVEEPFLEPTSADMPNDGDPQRSKAEFKYYPEANKKCIHCEKLSIKVQSLQDSIERQNNSIIKTLAEYKVLLSKIVSQENVVDDIMQFFPIKSEEKLRDLNFLIESQRDTYVKRMKSLFKSNVGRYLNDILGQNIIYEFNVDGTHGKQSLKKFENFYSALIDAIAEFTNEPETALRKAIQLQKKRIFKANRLGKFKKKVNNSTISVSSGLIDNAITKGDICNDIK